VGRGIDQHRRLTGARLAPHQKGAARAPVLRIVRVAGAPVAGIVRPAEARHAARRSAAEDGRFENGAHAGRCTLVKRRKKFSVVTAASSSGVMPLSTASMAAVCTTKDGSLRLPRCGMGAR